jgi:hypothetical protein
MRRKEIAMEIASLSSSGVPKKTHISAGEMLQALGRETERAYQSVFWEILTGT